MPTRRAIIVLTLFLSTGNAWALGESRYEVNSRLIGYDLSEVTGTSSTATDLPRIVVKSGSEGIINLSKEIKVPTGSESKFYPVIGPVSVQHFRKAVLGLRMPIYVRQTEQEEKVTFLLRAELSQHEMPNEPSSTILKTTSSVRGIATLGKTRSMTIGAPGGKQATLEITFTVR